MNSVLTEALLCKMSRTESTPSSANETAPIWIPIVFFVLVDCVCTPAVTAEAKAPVDCRKKSRRVVSGKRSHLVICYARNNEFHQLAVFGKWNFLSGAQQFYMFNVRNVGAGW